MNQRSLSPELEEMRKQIDLRRSTFKIFVDDLNPKLHKFGYALADAIGDISEDEALDGLVAYVKDTVANRKRMR